jgi:hypothetical protein
LLETIRTGKGGEELLRPCPSLCFMLWSYIAPSGNKFELELMVRHPVAYPPLFPLVAASLPSDSLLRPSRINVSRQDMESSPTSSIEHHTVLTTPYSPPKPLIDKRLRSLQMKQWTNVSIANELAAKVLSLYIETDLQVLPLFNIDLFLHGFLHNKPYFCSKLLVNALFSWTCP